MLELMYITNRPDIAQIADSAGVDRVWIDLETKDKEKRQKNMDTVKSHHSISDIKTIKPLLRSAKLQVRVNHIYEDSKSEIDEVIKAGADYIMLPYYKTVSEVKRFIDFVRGRSKTILLLETVEAMDILDDTLALPGIDEMHIGLNDLHLSLKQDFMFESVANGIVDDLCSQIRAANIPYGFGGIARIGEGLIPAEMVLNEHYRLGSTRAILSRSFCMPTPDQSADEIRMLFSKELLAIREYEKQISGWSPDILNAKHIEFQNAVSSVVNTIRQQKG